MGVGQVAPPRVRQARARSACGCVCGGISQIPSNPSQRASEPRLVGCDWRAALERGTGRDGPYEQYCTGWARPSVTFRPYSTPFRLWR